MSSLQAIASHGTDHPVAIDIIYATGVFAATIMSVSLKHGGTDGTVKYGFEGAAYWWEGRSAQTKQVTAALAATG